LPSATSCGASRDAHRIGSRWSSRTCASATRGGISGLGATSPPRAATSRTMSYFSIFRSTNLPASVGSYSVVTHIFGALWMPKARYLICWSTAGTKSVFR
jgi:hypothetical protein